MNAKHYQVKEKTIRGITGFQIQWFQESYFIKNGFKADWHDVEDGWFVDKDKACAQAMDLEYDDSTIDEV